MSDAPSWVRQPLSCAMRRKMTNRNVLVSAQGEALALAFGRHPRELSPGTTTTPLYQRRIAPTWSCIVKMVRHQILRIALHLRPTPRPDRPSRYR